MIIRPAPLWETPMSSDLAPRYALFGNTQTVAWEDADGTIAWLALPHPDSPALFDSLTPDCGAGHFALEVVGPHTIERQFVGDTAILQTLITTPDGGKASMLDLLPLRPQVSPHGLQARVHQPRLIRVVEGHAGEVRFRLRFAPRPDGVQAPETEVDANGLLFVGERSSVVLQSEAEVHLHRGGATGEFTLKPQEKRHFVVTWMNDPDPDIPEIRATEADWEMDGTIDFWLQWGHLCPFQGVQRSYIVRLAAMLKALTPTPERRGPLRESLYASPYALLAPVALAAWGWEGELAHALAAWKPDPADALDRRQTGWLLWGLAAAQTAGLVEGPLLLPHWETLRPMIEALATAPAVEEEDRLAAWVGLRAAHALADELMLTGDAAAWRSASPADVAAGGARAAALGLGPARADGAPADTAIARIWRVRQALAVGGYLQARRLMDGLLQAYGPLGVVEEADQPHADPGELALALWTAAEIYLQEAPTPERVHLEGDLGN
jgi:hypothetical protein